MLTMVLYGKNIVKIMFIYNGKRLIVNYNFVRNYYPPKVDGEYDASPYALHTKRPISN